MALIDRASRSVRGVYISLLFASLRRSQSASSRLYAPIVLRLLLLHSRALTILSLYVRRPSERNVWVLSVGSYSNATNRLCSPVHPRTRSACSRETRRGGVWLTDRGRGSGAPRRGVDPGPPLDRRWRVGRDGGRSTARPGWPVSGVACGGWGGHRTGCLARGWPRTLSTRNSSPDPTPPSNESTLLVLRDVRSHARVKPMTQLCVKRL